jgi:hypothetical protein
VKETRERVALIIGVAAFIALLDWSYAAMIAPRFSYMGFSYHAIPLGLRVGSWALALAPSLWMPIALDRPSQVVYWFLYLLVLVPSMLVPAVALPLEWTSVLQLSGTLFCAFAVLGATFALPRLRIPAVRLSRLQFWLGFGLAAMALTGIVVKVFGLKLSLPSLGEVYGVRAEYKAALVEAGGPVGYAVTWLARVFYPVLLIHGFVRRNPVLFAAGLAGQLMLFSITGLKGVFFNALLVLTLAVVIERARARFGLWAVGGALGVTGLCVAFDLATNGIILTGIFVRRLIVTPGLLTGFYYEFFSQHPKALLGHSLLSSLSDYPYDRPPSLVVGAQYFLQSTNANASVWSDALANFGLGGVIAFSVLLGGFLWIFDSAARGHDLRVSAVLAGILGLILANTAFLTTLLTHGAALMVVLLLVMPREQPAPVELVHQGPAWRSSAA